MLSDSCFLDQRKFIKEMQSIGQKQLISNQRLVKSNQSMDWYHAMVLTCRTQESGTRLGNKLRKQNYNHFNTTLFK